VAQEPGQTGGARANRAVKPAILSGETTFLIDRG